MEPKYQAKSIRLKVYGKKFDVSWGKRKMYVHRGPPHEATFCVLTELEPLTFHSGIAVHNGADESDSLHAMRVAFKRAAWAYVCTNYMGKDFRKIMAHRFRVALREALGEPMGKPVEK